MVSRLERFGANRKRKGPTVGLSGEGKSLFEDVR